MKEQFPPFKRYHWVNRNFKSEDNPEASGAQELLDNFRRHTALSPRPNDAPFFIICGASGTGKTRLGAEIPVILKSEIKKSGFSSVHCFLQPNTSAVLFPFYTTRKVIDRGDDPEAEKALAIGIASSYFLNNSSSAAQQQLLKQSPAFGSFQSVVKAIREDLKIGDRKLALFIQLDEYQLAIPRVISMLRAIDERIRADFCSLNRVALIPILSGVEPMKVSSIYPSISTTQYRGKIFNLTPLDRDQSVNFFKNVYRYHNGSEIKEILCNPYLPFVLAQAGGHIRILDLLTQTIASRDSGSSWFKTEQDIDGLLSSVRNQLTNYYPKDNWAHLSSTNQDFIELIRTAFFREDIDRNTRFNGKTYGDAEGSGLFYLKSSPAQNYKFQIDFPPLLMQYLDKLLSLGLFHDSLLCGTLALDENGFERFVAQYICSSYRILSRSKREISLNSKKTLGTLFNGWLTGDPDTLEELRSSSFTSSPDITVQKRTAYLDQRKLTIHRQYPKAAVVRQYMENVLIQVKSGQHIILTEERSSSPDALAPDFDMQFKWSAYKTDKADCTISLSDEEINKERAKSKRDVPLVIFSPKECKAYVKGVAFVCGKNFDDMFAAFIPISQVTNTSKEILESIPPKVCS